MPALASFQAAARPEMPAPDDDDDDAGLAGFAGRREAAIAQPVATRQVHAEQFAGRQARFAGGGTTGQGSRPHRLQEIAPAGASQASAATG